MPWLGFSSLGSVAHCGNGTLRSGWKWTPSTIYTHLIIRAVGRDWTTAVLAYNSNINTNLGRKRFSLLNSVL